MNIIFQSRLDKDTNTFIMGCIHSNADVKANTSKLDNVTICKKDHCNLMYECWYNQYIIK